MEGKWWSVCVCGLKDWKKRCQLIKHVQLRDREWRKGKEKGKEKKFSLSWAWKQPVWAWSYPCWPHAEQQFLRSVNTSTQHVIADKPSVKTNTVQFTGKPDNVTERQDQRRRVSDLEGFHVVALITFLPLYVSKTCINKKCWNMWMWSLMERTPLFLATEATWDNISYYIFSKVIEASAQRKVPPFSRAVSVSVRAFLCSLGLHSKCGKLHEKIPFIWKWQDLKSLRNSLSLLIVHFYVFHLSSFTLNISVWY